MKTMCPTGYHHNGFVATHALGHMMYGSLYGIYIYVFVVCVCVHSVIRLHSTGKKPRSILGTPGTREEEEVAQQQTS